MKKRSMLSTLGAVTLLLPFIGAFVTAVMVPPVSAAASSSPIMTGYETHTNGVYTGTVTQFTFSMDGVVQQSAAPPTEADWITPSNYYDNGWGLNSWNEIYTYSNFGQINETNDPLTIPPTAAWATISSFQVEGALLTKPIGNKGYHYTVNGTDVLTATDASDIPVNALWALLASFDDGWTQTRNHTFSTYTLNRTSPSVQSLTISSNNGHSSYAVNGNEVTVALQTDIPIVSPVFNIGGVELTASGSGTSWSASLILSDSIDEGELSLSVAIYTEEGAPGQILTATTDGSSVILDNKDANLSYTISPDGPTNQDVIVQVAASDTVSGVELTKWALGTQTKEYFATQGTTFATSFTATVNGVYTVYARDVAGNEALLPVTISDIDRVNPTVSLAASTILPTNADIAVTVTAADNVAIDKQLWAEGLQDAAYFQSGNGILFTNQFFAAANGIYSVYVEDTASNYVLKTITVSNVFKQAPEITLTPFPDEPTNDTVTVGIEAQIEGADEGNRLAALYWAEGEQNTAFFADGGGQDVLSDLEFEGNENGRYSVYAQDTAGNETISIIDISNIDREAPILSLAPSTTAPTNDYVTITVHTEDTDSGLRAVRWSSIAPPPDSPWSSSEVEDGEFIVESNGMYTVIAFDNAGNKTIQQISVTNIMSDVPSVQLSLETTEPISDKVAVWVEAAALGDNNRIDVILWAAGDLPVGFFREGISTNITEETQFNARTNGTYTVYVRDIAGNETVQTIEIDNISDIDRENPTVSLAASTTLPTNADIAVTATTDDNVAIGKQLWAKGLQNVAYFQSGNGILFTNQFFAAANGIYSVYVEDTASNYVLKTITVSNLFKQAPEITLTPFPDEPTNESVTVGIEAQTEGADEGNRLAALYWAEGEQNTAFFADGGGQDVLSDLEFEGNENGRYSVYARDVAGNETISVIDISNIDRKAPMLTLTPNTTAPTNDYVTITVHIEETDSGLRTVRWSGSAPLPDSPWSSSEVEDGEFIVESNGTYTVIAFDNAGNETIQQISVTNIMSDEPSVQLHLETTEPIGDKVAVWVEAAALGADNLVDVILWAAGDLPVGFFREGISTNITKVMQFDARTNGTYTVYVRDIAGNEAVHTIEVDNIRKTNVDLAVLGALIANKELPTSPVFHAEQLNYTLKVDSNVEAIILTAEAADEDATVTINGNSLAPGHSASVALRAGVNTIRIVVTAQLTSVQRTYTIEATRQTPASSVSMQNNVFIAELNSKLTVGLKETNKRGLDGVTMYDLKLDDATAIAALAQASGENDLRIRPNSEYAPQIDAVTLTISTKALSQLKEKGIRLTLGIGNAVYELPAGFSAAGGGELIVELKALRQPVGSEQLLSGAAVSDPKGWQLKQVGIPVAITTNAINTTIEDALVIFLPAGLNETALRNIAVFLESSENSKAISSGVIRYDSQGQAIGIAFGIGASGRAILVQAEPITIKYESYINGYAGSSFAPARALTRAELAVLLMRLSATVNIDSATNTDATAFSDVPQTHWAAEAIAYVAEAGWMIGGPEDIFRPGDPLTRAELATVLVRWREVQVSEDTEFSDAIAHWASKEIASARREGWVDGYEDGSFRPSQNVTRAEVVTVMNRALGRPLLKEGGQSWSDVPSSHWAADAIRSASQSFDALYYLGGKVELMVK